MQLDSIFQILSFILLIVMAIMILVGMTIELWFDPIYRFNKWRKTRNKRLCDYPNSEQLMGPLIDGLLDSDLYWETERKAWHNNEIDEHLCITIKLSKKLKEEIKDRYYSKAMRNAHKRALQTLREFPTKHAYWNADEEFHTFYQKALEVKNGDCLICDNQGGRWLPEGASCQSFTPCNCEFAKNTYFG